MTPDWDLEAECKLGKLSNQQCDHAEGADSAIANETAVGSGGGEGGGGAGAARSERCDTCRNLFLRPMAVDAPSFRSDAG